MSIYRPLLKPETPSLNSDDNGDDQFLEDNDTEDVEMSPLISKQYTKNLNLNMDVDSIHLLAPEPKLTPQTSELGEHIGKNEEKEIELDHLVGIEEEEEFPWKIVIAVCLAHATESFSANLLYPFVDEYCEEWLNVKESQSETYAGFLVGIFNVALAISNPWLGALSDSYGRKAIILWGMWLSSICQLLMGLFRNVPLVFFLRFMSGFLNANLSVSSALLADYCRSQKNRSLGYVYCSGTFSFSRFIATFVAGVTVNQSLGTKFLGDFPYLLPLWISFVFNFLCMIVIYFYVPPAKEHKEIKVKEVYDRLVSGTKEIFTVPLVFKLSAAYSIHSFAAGYILLVLTLFAEMDISDHGYGFSISETSYLVAFLGFSGFILQLFVAKRITHSYRPRLVYIWSIVGLLVACAGYPLISFLYWDSSIQGKEELSTKQEVWVWILACFCSWVVGFAFLFGIPLVHGMISLHISRENTGNVMGTIMAVVQIFRGIGPFVAGWAISVGKQHDSLFGFGWFINFLSFFAVILLMQFLLTEQEKQAIDDVKQSKPDQKEQAKEKTDDAMIEFLDDEGETSGKEKLNDGMEMKTMKAYK